jgi:hypothetical protein
MTPDEEMTSKTMDAFKKRDINAFRDIYHEATEDAAISQDPVLIKIAVIGYCFNKLFSKVHYREKIERLAEDCQQKLANGNLDGILKEIEEFDRKHSFFEGNLVEKARVKIASRLYSTGLSISQSAELLNVRLSELLDYVGVTRVHNEVQTKSVMERLKTAREIFK